MAQVPLACPSYTIFVYQARSGHSKTTTEGTAQTACTQQQGNFTWLVRAGGGAPCPAARRSRGWRARSPRSPAGSSPPSSCARVETIGLLPILSLTMITLKRTGSLQFQMQWPHADAPLQDFPVSSSFLATGVPALQHAASCALEVAGQVVHGSMGPRVMCFLSRWYSSFLSPMVRRSRTSSRSTCGIHLLCHLSFQVCLRRAGADTASSRAETVLQVCLKRRRG